MVPSHIEVAYIPFEMGGPQPGIYLYTQAARMMRPVKQNSSQAPELIGTLEQYNMSIWYISGSTVCICVYCSCSVLVQCMSDCLRVGVCVTCQQSETMPGQVVMIHWAV